MPFKKVSIYNVNILSYYFSDVAIHLSHVDIVIKTEYVAYWQNSVLIGDSATFLSYFV